MTIDAYRSVAWGGAPVRIDDEALAAMDRAHDTFFALIESDPTISVYMVTTGGGEHAAEKVDEEKRKERRKGKFNLELAFGPPLPTRVARGITFARLTNFLEGHAATGSEIAMAIAQMLDGRALPPIPRRGHGGSGEIIPLGHLVGHLAPMVRDSKEGNALLNGSPCAAALVADAALAARERLALIADVLALSCEAISAPLENYGAALGDLWGDESETEALAAIRSRLDGAPTEGRRGYQTPVSWRIIPRVLGQAYRATTQAEQAAAISLRSITDNPVYVPPDDEHPLGQTFSTGGYHNSMATPAIDGLSHAWADLATLVERQCAALCNGQTSLLPDKLYSGEGGSMYYLCFIALGLAEEIRRSAQRTFVPPSSGGFAQSDVSPPTFFAWEQEETAAQRFEASLAILAAMSAQALFLTDRPAPPALAEFVEEVRRHVPPLTESRPLGQEIDALAASFRERVFAKVAPELIDGYVPTNGADATPTTPTVADPTIDPAAHG